MVKKPCVKMYLVKGNWIEAYPELYTEKQRFKLGILLNKLPVVKYSDSKKCNILSLYYYDKAVKLLEKGGFDVYVEERIPKNFKRLKVRINKTTIDLPSKRPTTWVKDKSKAVLPYQLKAVKSVLRRNKFILADQMGLGKTIEALCSMCYAFDMGYNRALVIVLSSLKEQWKEEIKKFTTFTDDDITILGDMKNITCTTGAVEKYHGGKKICKECKHYDRCTELKRSPHKQRKNQLLNEDTKIVITNYDILKKYVDQIIRGGFDIYIADEVTKLKNYNSSHTKAMMKIAHRFEFDDIFIPMSGTLIENRIQEFFPVFNMIDTAIFGTWTNFKNRYLVLDIFNKPIDIQNTKELKKIVSKFILRRTTDEVWEDRPEIFEMYRYCEMSTIHQKTYNEILEGEVEDLRDDLDKKVNRMQVASLLTYLIMVADTLEVVKDLGKHSADEFSCKIKMLKDIMTEEIDDSKVVLFSRYANKVIPIVKREMDKIGVSNLLVTGNMNHKKKFATIEKFKKKKKYKMLICSDATAYGANIQCAKYIINFDLHWNPSVVDQRIARVYRKGQTKNVTVINLVTRNTAEELVLDKIYSKQNMIAQFLKEGIRPKSILKDNISVDDILGAMANV